MKKLAIASQKGGVGKSTLAVNIATAAHIRGQKVLIMDLDPQGSALEWSERRREAPPTVRAPNPANIAREVQDAESAGYDLVIFDTAPHADRASMVVARNADLVAIPVRASTFDISAIALTLDLCVFTKTPSVVILNAAPIRSRVTSDARTLIEDQGGKVCPAIIHHRVAFQHSIVAGLAASEFDPGGTAEGEISELLDFLIAEMLEIGNSGVPVIGKAHRAAKSGAGA